VSLQTYGGTPITQWSQAQRYWRWCLILVYVGTIFCLSSLPGKSIPSVRVSDKLLHAVEFGGLALLLCRALRAQAPSRSLRLVALVSVLLVVGYGVTDEVHQLFVPERASDLADVAADGLGALLVAWGWVKGCARWPWLQ
jgi:VanZ family protein